MKYHYTRPNEVWFLDEGETVQMPERADEEYMAESFVRYEDTGYEMTLTALYKQIECRTVELVYLPRFGQLWIDGDGKLTGREINMMGTALYQATRGPVDVIVGNAVLIADPDQDEKLLKNFFEGVIRVYEKYTQEARVEG